MNLITLSGYVRKKNKIKRTTRNEDSLTFILEVTTDGKKNRFPCTVFGRLVKRVNKAVMVNDKVLIHGEASIIPRNEKFYVNVKQLELLDFIRLEDKVRGDKKKTKNKIIEDKLERTGI